MPMSEKDLEETERQFQKALDDARQGKTSAVFLVAVGEDDQAITFFSGDDDCKATAGSVCLSRVWEFLVKNGIFMPQGAAIGLGHLLRRCR